VSVRWGSLGGFSGGAIHDRAVQNSVRSETPEDLASKYRIDPFTGEVCLDPSARSRLLSTVAPPVYLVPTFLSSAIVEDGTFPNPVTPKVLALTLNTGDTGIIALLSTTGVTHSAISTITGGGTWTKYAEWTQGGSHVEIWWTGAGGAVATTSVSVAHTAGSNSSIAIIGEQWGGVAAAGNKTENGATGANPSLATATQDNDNAVVAFFTSPLFVVPTAGTGTLRIGARFSSASVTDVMEAAVDNTSAAPATVTTSITLASSEWAGATMELRSTTGGSPTPITGDITQGVEAPPQSAAGAEIFSGQVAQGVGAPPQSSSGAEIFSGTIAQTAGAPPQGATGSEIFAGSLTQGAGAPPQGSVGAEIISGAIAQGVDAPPQGATGAEILSGSITQGAEAPPQGLAGSTVSGTAGQITQGLEAPPQSMAGEVVNPVSPQTPDRSGGGSSIFPSDLYWGKRDKPRKRGKRPAKEESRESARTDVARREPEPDLPQLEALEGGPDSRSDEAPSEAGDREPYRALSLGAVAHAPEGSIEEVAGRVSQAAPTPPSQFLRGTVNDDNLVLTLLLLDDD
jgi:hypothetical protein